MEKTASATGVLERLAGWVRSAAERVREAAKEALPEDRPAPSGPEGGSVRPEG